MGFKKSNERYYMASVTPGTQGPDRDTKDAREMFGLEAGDQLVLLADRKKGIALQTTDKLNPMMRRVFEETEAEEAEEAEE
ncbi:MAG: AbrB family transcriptional regulator [Oscillospiraceae bacterium]